MDLGLWRETTVLPTSPPMLTVNFGNWSPFSGNWSLCLDPGQQTPPSLAARTSQGDVTIYLFVILDLV